MIVNLRIPIGDLRFMGFELIVAFANRRLFIINIRLLFITKYCGGLHIPDKKPTTLVRRVWDIISKLINGFGTKTVPLSSLMPCLKKKWGRIQNESSVCLRNDFWLYLKPFGLPKSHTGYEC